MIVLNLYETKLFLAVFQIKTITKSGSPDIFVMFFTALLSILSGINDLSQSV
jgi:hypothetical protein